MSTKVDFDDQRPGGEHVAPSTTRRTAFAGLALTALLCVGVVGVTPARADEPPPPALRSFTVALTGDFIPHLKVNAQAWRNGGKHAYDYRPMFADVQPLIEGADLAICAFEGPIAPPGWPYTGSPRFGAPAATAQSLKDVGYDRCTVANNHSNDKGPPGIVATINAFDAAALGHSGTGRDALDAVAPIIEVQGVKVAHLAYTFGFNGQRTLFTKSVMQVNLINPARIIADAVDARARGAEVVIVSLHWGQEFHSSVTATQILVAKALTASGQIDVVVGSHTHLLQPIKQINGKWVLFGLGNSLSNQRLATVGRAGTQDGVIAELRITENAGGGFTVERPVIVPTWVSFPTFTILDVAKHLNDPTLPLRTQKGLRQSWKRTTKLLGAFIAPLPSP